ncbi:hypothetical protein ACSFBM_28255 [Variovorax sp. GB1R11]|uniref:hypothetical protein n=1 Tax=Variovorax sp. GB1R11 TaxID=3443741 RepID=UPI003F48D46A
MIPSSQFRVVVEEVSPGAFAWAVVEHKGAGSANSPIAQSQKSFSEFELALEEGFAALEALPSSPRAP